MEWHALKALMAEENVDIDFDVPTDIELLDLVAKSQELAEEELDDEEGEEPLSI